MNSKEDKSGTKATNKKENKKGKKEKKSKIKEYEDWDSQKEYIIEKVIARRIYRGYVQYLIKWENFDANESTWENLEHLIEDNCFGKIFNYENLSLEEKINY